MITTAWGYAELVEEVVLPQSNDEREFVTHVQLLQDADGESLVRFAYATGGMARRGPVTLRVRDLERLGKALVKTPKLRTLLRPLARPPR